MKGHFNFMVLVLFLASLLVLIFSQSEAMFAVAYITNLVSIGLWLADDLVDLTFIKLTNAWFSLSTSRFVASPASTRTKTGQGLLLKRTCHPLRAHQRWLKARSGRGIRRLARHHNAF